MDDALIPIIEAIALDLAAWFRQRAADGKQPPTDEQVKARVRSKIAAGDAEAAAFEAEHPPTDPPA